ncbi:globin family protein [Thermus filiformis]|uniref:protoglobin domain-containing protein n=1 Tax=Thermus filiformis TaxID=276 RepID=UPI00069FC28C|nr:protoglobin domain-containing protein [Thermus filiformis]
MDLKETLLAVVRETQENIPPEARFREEDAEVLLRNRERILALKDRIVQGFYDILFAHPRTAQVFREGERPAREKTLEG